MNGFGYFTKVMYFLQIHFGLPSKAMYFSYILSYFRWKHNSISLDMSGYGVEYLLVNLIFIEWYCPVFVCILFCMPSWGHLDGPTFISSPSVQMPYWSPFWWFHALFWCPDALLRSSLMVPHLCPLLVSRCPSSWGPFWSSHIYALSWCPSV